MKLKQLKQRINNLKNPNFCYKIAKTEINSFYAVIIYHLAIETNVDTGHTRGLWVQALNRLTNVLSKVVPIPNYNIWRELQFSESLAESDEINISFNSKGLKISSTDEVWKSENNPLNKGIAEPNSNRIKLQNDLLMRREREYKGILGNTYQMFYVDRIITRVRLVLKGHKDNDLEDLSIVLRNYTKRLKEYIRTGK